MYTNQPSCQKKLMSRTGNTCLQISPAGGKYDLGSFIITIYNPKTPKIDFHENENLSDIFYFSDF